MSKDNTALALRRKEQITVYLPASIVSDIPHLREKTAKVGVIGRALAAYRVENVVIYRDKGSRRQDGIFIAKVLEYMETPQYLRKHLFSISRELKFAGILPPLRTPHHPLTSTIAELPKLSYRDGVVLRSTRSESFIEAGLDRLLKLNMKLKKGSRVSVVITKDDGRLKVQLMEREKIPLYWGFKVLFQDQSLPEILSSNEYDLVIATSKYGADIRTIAKEISSRWKNSTKIALLFGSPSRGLYEIFAESSSDLLRYAHYVVNFIPEQGVETIRTEEALFSVLAILNALA
ncbi:MAG: hypothetical protein DRJ33_06795 [Candidatus Methanomethylicota archaeon]|uniref:RNA-binding protein n=1 Tax=Thermoproteota archaeon TaxID=2056631 RepID=A0A497EU81_9CREN|nr:MAG: hypothetical protein DRJ33_06795 [Candidatus Verstraetearchaeota archaeon]